MTLDAPFPWFGGNGSQADEDNRTGNGRKERIWFSPHCLTDGLPFGD